MLTGNQCMAARVQAFTHAGGFPERGSHSLERADYQPARSREGFFTSVGIRSRLTAVAWATYGHYKSWRGAIPIRPGGGLSARAEG